MCRASSKVPGKEAWARGGTVLAGPRARDLCPDPLPALLCGLRGWLLPTASSPLASTVFGQREVQAGSEDSWGERPEYFFPWSPPQQTVLTMSVTSTKGQGS